MLVFVLCSFISPTRLCKLLWSAGAIWFRSNYVTWYSIREVNHYSPECCWPPTWYRQTYTHMWLLWPRYFIFYIYFLMPSKILQGGNHHSRSACVDTANGQSVSKWWRQDSTRLNPSTAVFLSPLILSMLNSLAKIWRL